MIYCAFIGFMGTLSVGISHLLSRCQEYPGERYAQVGSGKAFTGSGIALDDFGLRAGTEFAADSVCTFEYQTIVSGLAGTRLQ